MRELWKALWTTDPIAGIAPGVFLVAAVIVVGFLFWIGTLSEPK